MAEVNVKADFVAICGSDLLALMSEASGSLAFGHEWIGSIYDANVCRGALVTSGAFIGCGICEACSDGYDNYCPDATILGTKKFNLMGGPIAVPERVLQAVPYKLEPALCLIEVLAVAMRAVSSISQFAKGGKGDGKTLIVGCGAVGLLVAKILTLRGKRR